jgi:hypothetical protein
MTTNKYLYAASLYIPTQYLVEAASGEEAESAILKQINKDYSLDDNCEIDFELISVNDIDVNSLDLADLYQLNV